MNDLLARPYILLLLSIAALVAAVTFIADVPAILINRNNGDNSKTTKITTESFEIIDQALKESVPHDFFTYIGDFENPFRTGTGYSVTNKPSTTPKKVVIERDKLQLKGILSKNKPLAILEDIRGVSYIRGVGDSVGNQIINAIQGSNVKITDSKGTYEITVEEE